MVRESEEGDESLKLSPLFPKERGKYDLQIVSFCALKKARKMADAEPS
jgi:hypothetical protein